MILDKLDLVSKPMSYATQFALATTSTLDILVIENDPATTRLTVEAFKQAGLDDKVTCIPDGDDALKYLRRQGPYLNCPRPDLICLDLHLPKKSGLQVLSEIKLDPRLRATPVVVISGSDNPHEVREAYELHASCFIRKPNELDKFLHFIHVCFEFWATVVTLPEETEVVHRGVGRR